MMRRTVLAACSILLVAAGLSGVTAVGTPAAAVTGGITTVAGSGLAGSSGDCGPATGSAIWGPYGVALDPSGSVLFADLGGARVRKVTPSGTPLRVAGTGTWGFSGDGGPATAAQLRGPMGIAVDPYGNTYIADSEDHRIRKVDAEGVITTFAGTGEQGFYGEGDSAEDALLDMPMGLAVDPDGDLFIADTFNNRVRRVDVDTGVITTVAGDGSSTYGGDGGPATDASLQLPVGVAVDADENLYIADTNNSRIRYVDADTGIITTMAGTGTPGFGGDGGPASSALLAYPNAVVLSSDGDLIIADTVNNRIRSIDPVTSTITTIGGTGADVYSGDGGPATAAGMRAPVALSAAADGALYVGEGNSSVIRKIDAGGTISTIAGTGMAGIGDDCAPATDARLSGPSDAVTDAEGNLYIADTDNHRVRRVDAVDGTIATLAGTGTAGFSGDGGPADAAQLNSPSSVEVDDVGNVYIADTSNRRVRKVSPEGTITTIVGTGVNGSGGDGGPAANAQLATPTRLALDGSDNLYIADVDAHRIRRVAAGTATITRVAGTGTAGSAGDGGPATSAQLWAPVDVAVGETGDLYIADAGNDRVRRVDAATGVIDAFAGTGDPNFSGDGGPAVDAELQSPMGVEVDRAGNVFVSDTYNQRVRRVDAATGDIDTYAGGGTVLGDGGNAVDAQLDLPSGLGLDRGGNLLIADTWHHRVRSVEGDSPVGYLRVTTTPAVPGTILVDGVPRDSWGLTWVEFPVGGHQVCFGAVPGFTTPACQNVFVAAGQTTTVDGKYGALGQLRVTTTPALPSTVSVNGIPRNDWGVWTHVEKGEYQVCFGAVEDWTPPSCEDVKVAPGESVVVNGTFTPNGAAPGPGGAFGYLRVTTDPAVAAPISVDGQWRDSWGLTWLKLSTGLHTVCYGGVLYFTAPGCEVINITNGNTRSITGDFEAHGFLRVLTSPAVGATVFIDGEPANAWGVWTSVEPGSRRVCLGYVAGLRAPACETVAVTAGETTTVTGTYTVP